MTTRRGFLSTITAGAAALPVAGVASGRASAAQPMGANDRRLMELHAEWQRLRARRRELSEREMAIRAAMPVDLEHPAASMDPVVAAARAGADEATIERLRAEAFGRSARWHAEWEARGGKELDVEDEAIGEGIIELEHAIGKIPPDTVAGLQVYLDVIADYYPGDPSSYVDGEPWRHAISFAPESMLANMVAFMRRMGGADGAA